MKIFKKIKNRLFCNKGKHNWDYCIAGNRVVRIEGDEFASFADIPMRHCKDCDVSEEKWFDNKWRLHIKGNNKISKDLVKDE